MTREELAEFDGCDGRAAYVAVSGVIYDVSSSPLWSNGQHEGGHQAGQDLTAELKQAPHVRTLIERFPVIGQLQVPEVQEQKPTTGISLLSIIILAFVALLMIVTYMI